MTYKNVCATTTPQEKHPLLFLSLAHLTVASGGREKKKKKEKKRAREQKSKGAKEQKSTRVSRTELKACLNLANHGPLRNQFHGVPVVRLLLAVFQSRTLVVLQQPVHAAKVAVAKRTVTHDALGRIATRRKRTRLLLRRAAA